jgi:hypothetical protein
MPVTFKKLRIFLASPSDVANERAKVQTVVDTLKPLADQVGLTLEVVGWEHAVPDMKRPQQVIFDQLKPASWDVFIGILWHRFGSPTGTNDQLAGKEHWSGTEEEFRTVYEWWQKYNKPRIMMYRCIRPVDPERLDLEQFKHVQDFFAEFQAVKNDKTHGEHPGLYQSFDSTEAFEKLLLDHLQKLLLEYSEKEKKQRLSPQTLVEITRVPNRTSSRNRKAMETIPETSEVSIYVSSDNSKFSARLDQYLEHSKHMVMLGTGLNIISQNVSRHEMLIRRARTDSYIEIYAANPFSPNVQTRLIEEEIAKPSPRIRKKGLVEWIVRLLKSRDELRDPSRLVVRLFPFYPTYALFIFDEQDYFFYPYGYTQLGNLSPVLHFSKANESHQVMVDFLQSQYLQVKDHSAEAELIFKLYHHEKVAPEDLVAFAVYLVPPSGSALYEFGSDVLGYDVRAAQVRTPGKWPHATGAAHDFGFHLTVADALYSASAKDLDLISREVEFVAQGFRPFTINLSLQKDFPNSKGIALVCEDKSGSLEAIHHEMVTRVYSKAAASNYSLGVASADRDLKEDQRRSALMIEHYYAPYILQRFKPHFSLLSSVPPEEKDKIYEEVKSFFEERAVETSLEVTHLAVMHRPSPKGHWEIRKQTEKELCEYALGDKKP